VGIEGDQQPAESPFEGPRAEGGSSARSNAPTEAGMTTVSRAEGPPPTVASDAEKTPTDEQADISDGAFIRGWYLSDLAICDRLIEYHRSSDRKKAGNILRNSGDVVVDIEVKESFDVVFPANSTEVVFKTYVTELQKVIVKYKSSLPCCDEYSPWGIIEGVNLQRFPKGGGYKTFHMERVSMTMPNASRHLVFMTYLNDLFDNGETEFLHQKLFVSPRKGLTLIWPADWTHTHRGIQSPSEEKYIITGWLNFC
jgi:hypothetical protein